MLSISSKSSKCNIFITNCPIALKFMGKASEATVKREMLVAIKFGGFENITIWQRFNLEIMGRKWLGFICFSFGDYMY